MAVELKALPPREAIRFWAAKVPMPAQEFYTLAAEQRVNAFAVSGIAKLDQLLAVHDSLGRAMHEGASFQSWKKSLPDLWKSKGWVGPNAYRVSNIFHTNIQTAYNVGRYRQMMAVASERPIWTYIGVNDRRQSQICRRLNGRSYPYDHEFWKTYYPPNHFRCRSTVSSQGVAQAERAGVKVLEEIPADVVQPENGFDTNPGQTHYQPDLSKYPALFKQQFLEGMNKFYSPDTLPGVTRGQFGELLKKTLRQADLQDMQTLVWAEEQGGVGGYRNWVNQVLSRQAATGEVYPAGNLPLRVLGKLQQQPRLALVVVDDQALLHMVRDLKKSALTAAEIASIPEKFAGADWYRDKEDPALLLTWLRSGENWIKVVIRLDQKIGKGIANRIVSAGVVKAHNLEVGGRYGKL